jgi:cell division protein FtsB
MQKKEVIDMNEEKDVPFKAYESVQARAEERFKKMWITIIILILLLVGSNFGWLIYESQYQDVVTTTQTVSQNTSEGGANSN